MQHPVLRFGAVVALLGYLVLLTWLSLRTPGGTASFDGADKLYHALAYGGLMCLSGIALGRARLLAALIATVAFGILMEIAQGALTALREPSLVDIVANSIGAGLVWAGLAWLAHRN